ncbi:MAG TPA: glycosyltransferase [Pseudobacteroides sp.]|uniref:glycosyltransferase family 2 protein n=1 Tax=Pseudobacteroides sp. TaxID=1968840 RepID=UPI002F9586A5
MLLSVIVPVYNTEKHLKKCIESILGQTYKQLELILVDDGSQDKSGEICDYFANTDGRVIVIHRENAGVSASRNLGIDIAKGDYITFVDSDDWLEENTYDILIGLVQTSSSDIVVSNSYFRNDRDIKNIGIPLDKSIYSSEEAKELLLKFQFSTSLWMCVYKRSIIDGLYLNESIHYWEDLEYQYRLIDKSEKIVINTKPLYHYREGSITHNTLNEKKLSCLKIPEIFKQLTKVGDNYTASIITDMKVKFLFELATLGAKDPNHSKECDSRIRLNAKNILTYVIFSKSYKLTKKLYLLILTFNPKLYYFLFNIKYKFVRV